jgi:hypothetical protein
MRPFVIYAAFAVLGVTLIFILLLPKILGKLKPDKVVTERRRHSEKRDPHMLSHSDFRDTHSRREHY